MRQRIVSYSGGRGRRRRLKLVSFETSSWHGGAWRMGPTRPPGNRKPRADSRWLRGYEVRN